MDIGIPQISILDYKIDIWNEYSSITVIKKVIISADQLSLKF